MLDSSEGEIASRALNDCAQGIIGATQAAGDPVGEIEGAEIIVDVLHLMQHALGGVEISGAHEIEHRPAHFAGALGHPIEVAGGVHAQLGRGRQGLIQGNCEAASRFHHLLLRILEVPGVLHFGVARHRRASLAGDFTGLGQERLGFGELLAVDMLDALATGLDQGAAGFQSLLTGGVFGLHVGFQRGDDLVPSHSVSVAVFRCAGPHGFRFK